MVSEEIIRLILDIQQNKDPADLAAKFQTLKTKLTETAAAYDVLERQVGEYNVAAAKSDAALDKEVQSLTEATRARKFYSQILDEHHAKLTTTITTTDKAIGTKGAGGMGMLGLSYAVQDFTSQVQNGFLPALSSIQNNIPQILAGLGVGAGMTGVISLAAVGVGLAVPLISSMASGTKDAGEKAEEAAKKLHGFNDQLEKLVDAGKKLRESKSATDEATEKAIGGAINAAGKQVIAGGLDAHLRGVDESMEETQIDDEMRRQGNEESFFSPDAWKALREKIRPKVRAAARGSRQGRVDAVMGSLAGGDESTRQMVAGLARNNPEQFGPDTADLLDAQSPEARAARERNQILPAERQGEADIREDQGKRASKIRDEVLLRQNIQRAAKKRHADERVERDRLERQGEGNAAGWDAERSASLMAGSDIDERAGAYAARLRGQGGGLDRYGRFRELNSVGQENAVRAAVSAELRRMGIVGADNLCASKAITDAAQAQVSKRAGEASVEAMKAGLNANQAAIQAMKKVESDMIHLAEQARQQARMADQIRNAAPVQMRRGAR